MWEKTLLLLLHAVEAVVASQCWQGETFSEAVVSPAVKSSSILRVPGVTLLPQCVAASCELPGYDLAWMFEGRCYILSCQQRENCQPRSRPGADSVLAFLRRLSPQTLVLHSLVRGEPYGGRWRPSSHSSETTEDLDSLKDLAPFDVTQQDFLDPGMMGVEYPDGSQEERGGTVASRSDAETTTYQLTSQEKSNLSEAENGLDLGPTESSEAQNRTSSGGTTSPGDEPRATRPADPFAAETTTKTESSTDSTSVTPSPQKPTDFTQNNQRSSVPTLAPPHWTSDTPTPPDLLLTGSTGTPADQSFTTVTPGMSVSPKPMTDAVSVFLSTARAPPTTMTSDPTITNPPTPTKVAVTVAVKSAPGAGSPNRRPVAFVGPDKNLFLPLSSLLLDGSGSTDDHVIVSYHWDMISGPPGLKLEGADKAVAMATGFRMGRYTFKLTVRDQEGVTDSALLTVRIQEARSLPPIAHASGSHTLTLPNNSIVLRGSMTDGDQREVHYLWVRDNQSPAAGDVLYDSQTQASLYLSNLVEGTYLFQLRVTDAQGRTNAATATVEVRPEPGGAEQVELEMLVSVSQVSVAQRDTVVRQLAALLHVLDSDVQVRALRGHSHLSSVLRFSVRGPSGPLPGSRLVDLLRSQLLREKSDYLLFRVLRVDTVLCLLSCSGHGQCDPISKQCACDPFWTVNLIRRYLGDGRSNCEWHVLYVILTSFVLVVFILSVSWTFICCCRRRRQTKGRKKTKYTILDNMDEQERVELRPKFSIKHRSTEHNSSLMMSESELDSDQDTIFSQDRPVRSRNRLSAQAARNGNAFG